MTSGLHGTGADAAAARGARRPWRSAAGAPGGGNGADRRATATAVLLATAPDADGGPAAALPWDGGTLLSRLVAQLDSLRIGAVEVLTRPGWEAALRREASATGLRVRVTASPDTPGDLRALAALARRGDGDLVLALGDIVTHREALAGLLADPRLRTALLVTAGRLGRPFAFGTRASRGRVVSAGSPYHYVRGANNHFLGIVKVAAADRPALGEVAERLAELTTPPLPDGWDAELSWKAERWRRWLGARAERLARGEADVDENGDGAPAAEELEPAVPDDPEPDPAAEDGADEAPVTLGAADEEELRRRVGVARQDAVALLVVGLVRAGVDVRLSHLRKLFWARPLSREGIERAAERIRFYDEDRVLLDSAVKANDGFFTTFFVSPYSKYIARWAAHRGFTPNGVTTVSMVIGLLAAAAFATGDRVGMVAGAVLLQAAFTADCVDGQLARYTRTFSKLGAWLDSVFDRGKEYVVFAGLAIGASRAGDPVWVLAGAALTLQTVRHMSDFSYGSAQHEVIGATRHPPLDSVGDGDGLPPAWRREPPPPSGRTGPRPAPEAVAALSSGTPASAPVAGEVTAPLTDAARTPAPASADAASVAPVPPPRAQLAVRVLRAWRVLDRWRGVRWVKKMIVLPIGERFAAISLTAALSTPRTTFVVLLAWGSVAMAYALAGRVLRSLRR